jgi:hypothetical protein
MTMHPIEFKVWLENCIRDAKANGLPEDEICLEFLEQTRMMLVKQQLKIAHIGVKTAR